MLFSSDLLQANHVTVVVEATAIREPHGTLVVVTKYDIPLIFHWMNAIYNHTMHQSLV